MMFFKKIYLLAFLAFACGSNSSDPAPKPPVSPEEPKQYGIPFEGVADPQRVVLYEVNIRAFSAAGDFQGVIDRLDEIKSLGINTIWLMPIHPVGQVKSAGGLGSPYAVKNYLEVNTEFGDLEKLRELVTEAHNRNMSVILDWVANHTAWDNDWMVNKSWYTQDAQGNVIIPPGTNWQDVAELNYNNYDMRKAMIQAMKYWILEANVDGFRCDAVDYVPTDFWTQAITALKSIPNRKLILLAEGSKQEQFAAGFQINYAWDFLNNLEEVYQNNRSANTIFTTHQEEYNKIPAGGVKLRYTTNHDESAWEATPVETFGGTDQALSASVITIFTSAAPLLYSSQEVGREDKLPFFTKDPIDWNANQDMFQQYQKLLTAYTGSLAFSKGTLQSYTDDDVAIFTRKKDSDEYLIVVNVRNTVSEITWDESLQNQNWTDALKNESFITETSFTLQPFEYLILKKI
ncbi:MAG TPA: alpha-amylase family glycosyl hydrolase [Ohtaekwangia sp.]